MARLRRVATPYGLTESFWVVWKNTFGIDRRRHLFPMRRILRRQTLDPVDNVTFRIAFLGDIMSVGRFWLKIDSEIKRFIEDCDCLVANLEATITSKRRRPGVLYGALQHQDAHVIHAMGDMFPPKATYLCLANNHAGDFDTAAYRTSCDQLQAHGFNLFGQSSNPDITIGGHVRVHAGTMWSNQITDRIQWLESFNGRLDRVRNHRLNILYPHWGYELEMYPRSEIVALSKTYIQNVDAVIGHHPHVVQPVVSMPQRLRHRLIAFSLGDFCTNIRSPAYRYGMVLKIAIGNDHKGRMQIGEVQWIPIESRRTDRRHVLVQRVDRIPCCTWMT